MKEPHLSAMLRGTIQGLEENIPQMITFAEGIIDLQPWERWAKASYVSDSETKINLMSLMRNMIGHASVPGVFGRGLMDRYPTILQDIYDMDSGFIYFLIGLPQWTPWPSVSRAHRARQRVWQALDEHQRVLDATIEGKHVDSTWGDLDDVSDLIWKRHEVYRGEIILALHAWKMLTLQPPVFRSRIERTFLCVKLSHPSDLLLNVLDTLGSYHQLRSSSLLAYTPYSCNTRASRTR